MKWSHVSQAWISQILQMLILYQLISHTCLINGSVQHTYQQWPFSAEMQSSISKWLPCFKETWWHNKGSEWQHMTQQWATWFYSSLQCPAIWSVPTRNDYSGICCLVEHHGASLSHTQVMASTYGSHSEANCPGFICRPPSPGIALLRP